MKEKGMWLKSGVEMCEHHVQGWKVEVTNLEDASRKFQQFRDEQMKEGFGSSEVLPAFVVKNGRRIGYISWNGRVWNPKAFKGGNKDEYLISEAVSVSSTTPTKGE